MLAVITGSVSTELTNQNPEVRIRCGNNNSICGCFGGNNWWWIIILLLIFCNCGCGGNNWNGCENNNNCGCC